MDNVNFINSYLPSSVQDLLIHLNEKTVYTLINEYGGTRLIIPKKANIDSDLARLIGISEMEKLCRLFDGGVMYCPRCLKALNLFRDRQILLDKRAGLTLSELARKNNLTERGISKSLRRVERQEYLYRLSEAQQDLFNC